MYIVNRGIRNFSNYLADIFTFTFPTWIMSPPLHWSWGRQVILAGPKCRMPGPEVSYRYEAQFSGLQVLSQTITAWDTQYRLSTQRCSMRLEIVPSRNTEQTRSSLTVTGQYSRIFCKLGSISSRFIYVPQMADIIKNKTRPNLELSYGKISGFASV